MSLPDSPREGLLPPARALAASAIDLSRRLAWHTLHPRVRERFLSVERPALLPRLDYRTTDGWTAPLFRMDPPPGASGEPLLLAPGLGFSTDAYRCGTDSLAQRLCKAGFTVYLFAHRGHRQAVGSGSCDVDGILEQDVPAALQAILDDSGADSVHWVGHHLGGQLGLLAAARGEALASLVALGAPVTFEERPHWRRLQKAAAWLPDRLNLPLDRLARLALPFVGDETAFGDAASVEAREMIEFGADRLPASMLRQVLSWFDEGVLCSRSGVVDYTATLGRGNVPLLVVYHEEDPAITAPLKVWRHSDARGLSVDGGALDLALGGRLDGVVEWVGERRQACWPLVLDASTA